MKYKIPKIYGFVSQSASLERGALLKNYLAKLVRGLLLSLPGMLIPFLALAHEGDEEIARTFVSQIFAYDPLVVVSIAAAFILFPTLFVLIKKPQAGRTKLFFFLAIAFPVIITTLYLTGGTIYKNVISATKGPVHWHADFRIIKCGEELDLIDPRGLFNRVGTSLVHEHGDSRIHIEGTLSRIEDASLHNFIEHVGGVLTNEDMLVPTSGGEVSMQNGELCSDGEKGVLQVFLWETRDKTAHQRKLENFSEYTISPKTLVPPGDCIIFEFGEQKEKTDRICGQYRTAEKRGDIIINR